MTSWTARRGVRRVLVGGRDARDGGGGRAGGRASGRHDRLERVRRRVARRAPGRSIPAGSTPIRRGEPCWPTAARARGRRVAATLDQLDSVAAALLFTDAQLLCAPTMADRVAALAVAAAHRRPQCRAAGARRMRRARLQPVQRRGRAHRRRRSPGSRADEGAAASPTAALTFDAGPARRRVGRPAGDPRGDPRPPAARRRSSATGCSRIPPGTCCSTCSPPSWRARACRSPACASPPPSRPPRRCAGSAGSRRGPVRTPPRPAGQPPRLHGAVRARQPAMRGYLAALDRERTGAGLAPSCRPVMASARGCRGLGNQAAGPIDGSIPRTRPV